MMMRCVNTVQVYSGELTGCHEVRVFIRKTQHTKQNIQNKTKHHQPPQPTVIALLSENTRNS